MFAFDEFCASEVLRLRIVVVLVGEGVSFVAQILRSSRRHANQSMHLAAPRVESLYLLC